MNSLIPRRSTASAERAVLETLAYFDVFDFPVRAEELHRYLHGTAVACDDLQAAIDSPGLSGQIEQQDGYYVLAGRRFLIDRYAASARQNARRLQLALGHGAALSRLPFIRMVGVTGSVAMRSGGSDADFDYLLITEPGRLWLARLFAIAFGRRARLDGYTLCPNIVLSERALLWPHQDLYSAHELTQMIPVAGMAIYARLRDLNAWTGRYLPNAGGPPALAPSLQRRPSALQRVMEPPLRTALGSALEQIEMGRKVARFRRQSGFGLETVFSADVCQGNFDNHGDRTRRGFERRLTELGLASPVASSRSGPPASAALGPAVAGQGAGSVDLRAGRLPAVTND